MFGKDVLDHFRPRWYWHELAIVLVVSGFVVVAILIGGGRLTDVWTHETRNFASWLLPSSPGTPEPTQSAGSKPEIVSTSPAQQAHAPSPASPDIQFVPSMPMMPFELSGQSATYDGWPPVKGSNQTSVADVPLPIARPVIKRLQKSAKSDELINGTQNGEVEKQNRSVDQTGDIKRQSKTTPKSIKSQIDARKAAAAELEKDYADADVAISTRVSGLGGTVLNLNYSQFNDATVKKIMGVSSFTTALAQVGFKTIIFTGDQNKTWSFPLQPPPPSTTATQGVAPGDRMSKEQPAPGPTD
jgi:hypothetical protein